MKNTNKIIRQNMEYGIWNMEWIYSKFKILNSKFQTKGFTLIELMVVIAIIGVLSTILIGPLQNTRNKAADAKKVADLEAVSGALTQYADAKGYFPSPANLRTELVPQFLDSLPKNFDSNVGATDRYMYVTYNDASGTAIGYHLIAKLLVPKSKTLDSDADCSYYGTNCMPSTVTVSSISNNYSAASYGDTTQATTVGGIGAIATDALAPSVVDDSTTVCNSAVFNGAGACLYDIRGSY